MSAWIAVDLDGTIAHYDHDNFDPFKVGAPIAPMVARVKAWLADGVDVRIFTARVDGGEVANAMGAASPETVAFYRDVERIRALIQAWCVEHIGVALPVTNRKDYGMIRLYDDRCRQVITNTGEVVNDDEF